MSLDALIARLAIGGNPTPRYLRRRVLGNLWHDKMVALDLVAACLVLEGELESPDSFANGAVAGTCAR